MESTQKNVIKSTLIRNEWTQAANKCICFFLVFSFYTVKEALFPQIPALYIRLARDWRKQRGRSQCFSSIENLLSIHKTQFKCKIILKRRIYSFTWIGGISSFFADILFICCQKIFRFFSNVRKTRKNFCQQFASEFKRIHAYGGALPKNKTLLFYIVNVIQSKT